MSLLDKLLHFAIDSRRSANMVVRRMMGIGRGCTHFAMLCTAILFLYFVSAIHAKPLAARLESTAPLVDQRTRPMTFRAYQECSGNGCPYFVLAQGVITPTSPRAFRQFLATEKYQPSGLL